MKFPKHRKKLTVVYKSGAKVHLRANEFSVTQYASGHREAEWVGLRPHTLLFGLDDVAAIYWGAHV